MRFAALLCVCFLAAATTAAALHVRPRSNHVARLRTSFLQTKGQVHLQNVDSDTVKAEILKEKTKSCAAHFKAIEDKRKVTLNGGDKPGQGVHVVVAGGGPAGLLGAMNAYLAGVDADKIKVLEMRDAYVRRNMLYTSPQNGPWKYVSSFSQCYSAGLPVIEGGIQLQQLERFARGVLGVYNIAVETAWVVAHCNSAKNGPIVLTKGARERKTPAQLIKLQTDACAAVEKENALVFVAGKVTSGDYTVYKADVFISAMGGGASIDSQGRKFVTAECKKTDDGTAAPLRPTRSFAAQLNKTQKTDCGPDDIDGTVAANTLYSKTGCLGMKGTDNCYKVCNFLKSKDLRSGSEAFSSPANPKLTAWKKGLCTGLTWPESCLLKRVGADSDDLNEFTNNMYYTDKEHTVVKVGDGDKVGYKFREGDADQAPWYEAGQGVQGLDARLAESLPLLQDIVKLGIGHDHSNKLTAVKAARNAIHLKKMKAYVTASIINLEEGWKGANKATCKSNFEPTKSAWKEADAAFPDTPAFVDEGALSEFHLAVLEAGKTTWADIWQL